MTNNTLTGDLRVPISQEGENQIEDHAVRIVKEVEDIFRHWPKNHIIHERVVKVNYLTRLVEQLTTMAKEI